MAKKEIVSGSWVVQTALEQGPEGPRGMLPYPAGEYSSSITYTATKNISPFVLYSSVYYVMNKVGTWLGNNTGKTPAQDYAENGVNAMWIPFEAFKAIYVELLMARLGLIGKAVFFDEYMFSQHGKDSAGNPSTNYQGFADGSFIPSILFNFMTGAGHVGNKSIRWNELGLADVTATIRYPFRYLILDGSDPEYNMVMERGGNVIAPNVASTVSNSPYKGFLLPDATSNPGATIRIFHTPIVARVDYQSPFIWTTGRFFSKNVNFYDNVFTQIKFSEDRKGGEIELRSLPAGNIGEYNWYIVDDSKITYGYRS